MHLELDTTLPPDELTAVLRHYEPWGHRIDFSNGVSTASLARRAPFSETPLHKLTLAAKHIPFPRGGALLDIGCNSGHNTIHAARVLGMQATGIDVTDRHIEVARFLSELAGIEATFLREDAETFSRPGAFDVVLHFGTLYHLPNPLLALQVTFDNLKPGGWLALETHTYDHPDDPHLCQFVHMHNNDPTNFWALSERVLRDYLALLGFVDIAVLLKANPPALPRYQGRILLVARKAQAS